MRWKAALLGLTLLATPGYGFAHHSIAAVYDRDKAVAIDGRLVNVELVNPHSSIAIEVRSATGTTSLWRLETSGAAGMQRMGIRADTLTIGDPVKAVGYPARSGERAAWLTRLETRDRVFNFSLRTATPAPKPVPVS
jgi:hypothetical protein